MLTSQRTLRFAALFAVGLLGLHTSLARSDDYNVEVRGRVYCEDRSTGREWFPMTGARVTVMNSNTPAPVTILDDEMGHDFVQPDGSFDVHGSGGDWGAGWSSPPDVYVRVDYNSDMLSPGDHGVNLRDEWGVLMSFDNKMTGTRENVSGLVDFSGELLGIQESPQSHLARSSRCAVWYHAQNVYHEYEQWIGQPPPLGIFNVRAWNGIYGGAPRTVLNTTHWVNGYPTDGNSVLASYDIAYGTGGHGSMRREFGLSLRERLDGDQSEFTTDSQAFGYGADHLICEGKTTVSDNNAGFAFNQGWAEFWAQDTDPNCAQTNHAALDGHSMQIEGNVAAALQALATQGCINANGSLALQKKRLHDVLQAHPGAIHSFSDFATFAAATYAGCTAPMIVPNGNGAVPPSPGWGFPEHQNVVARTVQALYMETAEVAAFKAGAEALVQKLPPCTLSDCHDALVALLAVPLLDAQLQHLELVLRRLEPEVTRTAADSWFSRIANFGQMATADESFAREVGSIDLSAFQAAKAALSPYMSASPEVADMSSRLDAKIAYLQFQISGLGTPAIARQYFPVIKALADTGTQFDSTTPPSPIGGDGGSDGGSDGGASPQQSSGGGAMQCAANPLSRGTAETKSFVLLLIASVALTFRLRARGRRTSQGLGNHGIVG